MRTEIYHTSSDEADIAAKQRPHPWAAAARPRLEASSWGARRRRASRRMAAHTAPAAHPSRRLLRKLLRMRPWGGACAS